jgi:hypothetical protein
MPAREEDDGGTRDEQRNNKKDRGEENAKNI